jgi:hypothetical protein
MDPNYSGNHRRKELKPVDIYPKYARSIPTSLVSSSSTPPVEPSVRQSDARKAVLGAGYVVNGARE